VHFPASAGFITLKKTDRRPFTLRSPFKGFYSHPSCALQGNAKAAQKKLIT